nr:hypothetical protein [Lysobacter sp. CAU 1642]
MQVTGGWQHTCVLTVDGAVKCWGSNLEGQVGDGGELDQLTAVDVVGLESGVLAISAGLRHTCALIDDGSVRCWGRNDNGQLGDNTLEDRRTPVTVQGLPEAAISVSAGRESSCVIGMSNTAYCWGDNAFGQLGNGDFTDQPLPVAVSGLGASVTALSNHDSLHACAIAAGAVFCWGRNDNGQVGDNSTTNRNAPVLVSGLTSGFDQVDVGAFHSCARFVGSGLKCWGRNLFGQLGDGNTVLTQPTPVTVSGFSTDPQQIALGHDHSCALLDGGGVRCWGLNDSRFQGGTGSSGNSTIPVDVSGLTSGVSSIGVGHNHGCAKLPDGTLQCWGENNFGMLGDGTTTNASSPVQVLAYVPERDVAPLTPAGNGDSRSAVPDGAGRFIVFESAAANLTMQADGNGASDIFRIDTQADPPVTVRVSLDDAEGEIDGASIEPSVSADGQLVVFVAPDAGVGKLSGESKQAAALRQKGSGFGVFLRNMLTGSTRRVGDALPGGTGTTPVIAPGAGAVVFTGLPIPGQGEPSQPNVFRIPLSPVTGGEYEPDTVNLRCVSCKAVTSMGLDTPGNADGDSGAPVVSGDGRLVAWETRAKNLLSGAPSPCTAPQTSSIMMRNMLTGVSRRVSQPIGFSASSCGMQGSRKPSLDWAGLNLAFESDEALVPGVTGLQDEVFALPVGTSTGSPEWVSRGSTGSVGNGGSGRPALSGDGRVVTFVSSASDLDTRSNDNNGVADIHARVLGGGAIRRLSLGVSGAQADAAQNAPRFDYNAKVLAFDSSAGNLVENDLNAAADVFRRALPATVSLISANGFE